MDEKETPGDPAPGASDPGAPVAGTPAEQRFPLRSTTRWLVPVALLLGVGGAILAEGTRPRQLYLGLTALVIVTWLWSWLRRPILVVGDEEYRVITGRRVKLRVRWTEIKHVRAVPAEQAMYLDCGDPRRNLLLPPRHGYGFRFHRQGALYLLLARRLEDRVEIASKLIPDPV